MKFIIFIIFLVNSGIGVSKTFWKCQNHSDQNFDENILKAEIVDMRVNHDFVFSSHQIKLIANFINDTNETYHVGRWNNFESPIVKVYEYGSEGKVKYVNSKTEVSINNTNRQDDYVSCSTETIFSKKYFTTQFLEYDLNDSYELSTKKKYCIETKNLFLIDLLNNKTIRTYGDTYFLNFENNWKVETSNNQDCMSIFEK